MQVLTASLAVSTTAHSGANACKVSSRNQSYNGINSCKVSSRDASYNGIQQTIAGRLVNNIEKAELRINYLHKAVINLY